MNKAARFVGPETSALLRDNYIYSYLVTQLANKRIFTGSRDFSPRWPK